MSTYQQQPTPPPLDLAAIEERMWSRYVAFGADKDDMTALVAEVRRLRAENADLRQQAVLREVVRMDAAQDVSELETSNARLRADLAAARAALEDVGSCPGLARCRKHFEVARAALADRP